MISTSALDKLIKVCEMLSECDNRGHVSMQIDRNTC